jgi:hypothetical protein
MLQNSPEVERENCSVVFKYLSRSLVLKGVGAGGVIPAGSWIFHFTFLKTTQPVFSSSVFLLCASTEPEFLNFYRLLSPDFVPAARLHRLAESTLWNRFLGSLNVYEFGLRYRFHGIDSL